MDNIRDYELELRQYAVKMLELDNLEVYNQMVMEPIAFNIKRVFLVRTELHSLTHMVLQ